MPGLDGSDCALHANCFSGAQQFTQTVVRMDSGILLTCQYMYEDGYHYQTVPYLLI